VLSSANNVLIFLTLYSVASAAAGVSIIGIADVARRVVPFSGAVLILISLFWVLPELASIFGWPGGAALLLCGSAVIYIIDRHIYPVCPACSHTHHHDDCTTRLHGFAGPLITAAFIHSMFDGWAVMAGMSGEGELLARAVAIGVAVHRLAEGLAFGVILRAAMKLRAKAYLFAAVTQSAMLLGGLLETTTGEHLGNYWIAALLALGGGMFLYLGFHAVHGDWKRRAAAQRQS
jgi:zinc transporter ZupT